jgi:hypothetical protein
VAYDVVDKLSLAVPTFTTQQLLPLVGQKPTLSKIIDSVKSSISAALKSLPRLPRHVHPRD